jgi:hypothetical protein
MFLTGYLLGSPTIEARLMLGSVIKPYELGPNTTVTVCIWYRLECVQVTPPSKILYVVPDSEDVLNATANCTINAPCDFATAEQLIEVSTSHFSLLTSKDQSSPTIILMSGNYYSSVLLCNTSALTLQAATNATDVVFHVSTKICYISPHKGAKFKIQSRQLRLINIKFEKSNLSLTSVLTKCTGVQMNETFLNSRGRQLIMESVTLDQPRGYLHFFSMKRLSFFNLTRN